MGKPITLQLIESLAYPEKTVIAHILLTQIWKAPTENHTVAKKYIYQHCDKLIGAYYIYNGLVWKVSEADQHSIDKADIEKIQRYWQHRILNQRLSTPNIDAILKELQMADSIKYPCLRVYQNNSAFLKEDDLNNILEMKANSSTITNLFSQLGNDSTHSYYNDCFYITYKADGLSFRFEPNGNLTTIFIESDYKGQIPYDIHLSDKRSMLEKKVGSPRKTGHYSDHTWASYSAKKIWYYIDYDRDDRVTAFQMSKR